MSAKLFLGDLAKQVNAVASSGIDVVPAEAGRLVGHL